MTAHGQTVPRASWRTLLGDYPNTRALRSGAVASSRLTLMFDGIAVPNKAFKRVVRDLEFDVAELALMTYLMARSRDVPLRLLPVVLFRDSRDMAGPDVDPSTTPIGFEANRRNLEVAIAAAAAQGLLARPLAVEDLVTDVLAALV